MRKEDEAGSERRERSGFRDGERERGSGHQEREIIRVGQVESVKLIIEVN